MKRKSYRQLSFFVTVLLPLFIYGCEADIAPNCDTLNTDIPIMVRSEYPGTVHFWFRVVNVHKKKIESSKGYGLFGSNPEYECEERSLYVLAFRVKGEFEGTKKIQDAKRILSLEGVIDQFTNKPLIIDPSARNATSILIKPDGRVVGLDLIN